MKRFKSAAERGGVGPIIEELRVSEANEVDLEIAYNDTPFYARPEVDEATQLKDWGRTIARATFKIGPIQET
jgi:hypothetical protein